MMPTHAQAMAYRLARDLISSEISGISQRIGIEEGATYPNRERVLQLEAQIIQLAGERELLDPDDDKAVRDVLQRFSGRPLAQLLETLES